MKVKISSVLLILCMTFLSCENYCLTLYGNPYCELNSFTEDGTPVFYVSYSNGNDRNPGSKEHPMKTIRNAVEYADSLYDKAHIYISKGSYEVNYSNGHHIILPEGISLFGGYSLDWLERNSDIYTTSVYDTSSSEKSITIEIEENVSEDTVIDGLWINSGGGDESYCLYIKNSSPTITNNIITAGSGYYNYGIYLENSQSLIDSNRISGGSSSADYSYGIYLKSSDTEITNNIISGGNGIAESIGIVVDGSSPLITYNEISGGLSYTYIKGLYIKNNSSPVITNNDIRANTNPCFTVFAVGIDAVNSNSLIKENTIYGKTEYTNTLQCEHSQAIWFITDDTSTEEYYNIDIKNNIIHGGYCDNLGAGIMIQGTYIVNIINNIIHSGYRHYKSTTFDMNAVGVNYVNKANIFNNTIFGPDYEVSVYDQFYVNGIYSIYSNTRIINNIIAYTYRAICEECDDSTTIEIKNNVMVQDVILYHYKNFPSSNPDDTISDNVSYIDYLITNYAYNNECLSDYDNSFMPTAENVNFNDLSGEDGKPDTLSDNDWRLTEFTPQVIIENGKDLSLEDIFPINENDVCIDLDNIERTGNGDAGWSAGAYEFDF